MGAKVTFADTYIECTRDTLHGIDMDMNAIPDAAMTIATTALFAEGTTTIRNIYNWRVKETDRLSAMAAELRKVGAQVEEGMITFRSPRRQNCSMRKLKPITITASPCVSRWWHCQTPRSRSSIRAVRQNLPATSVSWRHCQNKNAVLRAGRFLCCHRCV